MRENVRVCVPRLMQIGAGSRSTLPEILQALGNLRSPLIVTDKMMVRLGIAGAIKTVLEENGYRVGIYDAVLPDPTVSCVLDGIVQLEADEHDCVIGVGGGSPLDVAKAISVFSQHSRNVEDYRPPKQFNTPGLPLIAIPTTAGTGSEVTHHTVLINDATREKISCRGEGFVPLAAVIDYELTLSKPKRLSADNALDTLTHAMEAYVSPKRTLFSDRIALDCMRLVGKHIAGLREEHVAGEVREGLMLAAMFGGLAFTNASIGLVHGMSRPIGAIFHVPHGMGNAMLLPTLVEFALSSAPDRFAECARAIGFAQQHDDDAVANEKLVKGLREWNEALAVPSLRGFGIDAAEFIAEAERMTEDVIASGAHNNSPRIASKDEIVALYRELIAQA